MPGGREIRIREHFVAIETCEQVRHRSAFLYGGNQARRASRPAPATQSRPATLIERPQTSTYHRSTTCFVLVCPNSRMDATPSVAERHRHRGYYPASHLRSSCGAPLGVTILISVDLAPNWSQPSRRRLKVSLGICSHARGCSCRATDATGTLPARELCLI